MLVYADTFNKNVFQRLIWILVKFLLDVADQLFGKQTRVNAMLLPATDAIGDDD